jgi:retinol dehydrogenase-12
MDTDLSGKTILVTGATSGIGLATAEALARCGAAVIGVGRSPERCRTAERSLRAITSQAPVTFLVADLSLQSQVRELAINVQKILQDDGKESLDGLVNNAGTFTYWLTLTPEGFEMQWAVNYLAAFLLTNMLLPLLQNAPHGRVVTVSSGSHYGARLNWEDIQLRRHYNGLRAYMQTKLANVLFTLELNRRLGSGSSVRAFAADPGLVNTDIGLKGNPAMVRWIWKRRKAGGITPEEAAKGVIFLLRESSLQAATDIYWLHGRPKSASRYALDSAASSRLWAISARMCGIPTENAQ